MNTINKAIGEYQDLIGSYDKHQWERSFDQAVNKGLNTITRKRGKVNRDFIDVDIVRGSAFSNSKQRHNFLSISLRALTRVIFLPFCRKWWHSIGGKYVYNLLLFLYFLHISTLFVYITSKNPLTEVLFASQLITPFFLMFIISLIHSQVLASSPHPQSTSQFNSTSFDQTNRDASIDGAPRHRRSREAGGESGRESSGSHDTGIDVTQNDNPGVSDSNADTQCLTNITKDLILEESNNLVAEEYDVITTQINLSNSLIDVSSNQIKDRSRSPSRASSQSQNKIKYIRRTKAWLQELSRETTPVNSFNLSVSAQRFSSLDRAVSRIPLANLESSPCRRTISESSLEETEMRQCLNNVDRSETSNSSLNSRDVQDESFSNLEEYSNLVTLSQPHLSEEDNSSESSFNIYEKAQLMEQKQRTLTRNLPILRRRRSVNKNEETKMLAKSCFQQYDSCRSNKDMTLKKRSLIRGDLDSSQVEKINDADEEDEVLPTSKRSSSLKKVCFEESGSSNLITVTPYESVSEFSLNEVEDNDCTSDNIQLEKATKIMKNFNNNSTKISCMIWEENELQKVSLSVLDIGWSIIRKVEKSSFSYDYFLIGFFFTILISMTPIMYHLFQHWSKFEILFYNPTNYTIISSIVSSSICCNWRYSFIATNGFIQRFGSSIIIFFLLSVSERTFYQRLLFAKNFCCLTSSRRARKYDLPHFRLNKVNNIKTWLLLRSFLKKRGPQRSVEILVSSAFLAAVVIVSMICIEMLQDHGSFLDRLGNWELVVWGLTIGIYLLRFITLGTRINKKYRNFSVLITEKINLYLHMEQKPHKKNELQLANNVLKLAEDLLKEVESPFKVSGMAANPLLYNIIRVFVLSAFSAVLTELLGFKLKLYKIK